LTLARLYATWDNWLVIGIRDSLAKGLGSTASWERTRGAGYMVYHSVKFVVDYGIAHRRPIQVTALGGDEIQYQKPTFSDLGEPD